MRQPAARISVLVNHDDRRRVGTVTHWRERGQPGRTTAWARLDPATTGGARVLARLLLNEQVGVSIGWTEHDGGHDPTPDASHHVRDATVDEVSVLIDGEQPALDELHVLGLADPAGRALPARTPPQVRDSPGFLRWTGPYGQITSVG